MKMACLKGGLLIGLMLLPQLSYAHLVETRFGEFYSGLLHPSTSLIHAIAWLALGLLAGLQTIKEAKKLIVLFPLAVVLGAILASVFSTTTYSSQINIEYINLASVVILGAAVVMAKRLSSHTLSGLAVLFGLTHGVANANADLAGNDQILYLVGVMVAAYLFVCLSSAGVVLLTKHFQWGNVAVRAIGSWTLAIGIIFSGFSLINLSV